MRRSRWSFGTVLIAAGLTALAAGPIAAQQHATDRGSWILGGAAGMASHATTVEVDGARQRWTRTYAHFNPRVQYFLAPGLAVGGGADLAHVRFDGESSTTYGAGPNVAYFFGAAEERALVPYVAAQANYTGTRRDDFGGIGYGASAGALYMLTGSVGLDGSLFYRAHRPTGDSVDDVRDRTFGVALGFSAFAF